ncbi:MAG: hypothetical protein ACFFEF_12350 [Candidatus Thorarchaeota archaeon]
MGENYDDYEDTREPKEPDWDSYRYYDEAEQGQVSLDATDYLALFVAALQTVFLPLVILIAVLFAFVLIFSLLV